MAVFIVLVTKNAEAVEQRLAALPKGDVFKLDADKFAVSFDGISKDLSGKIGLGSGSKELDAVATGIVFPVTTYWGTASPAIWEWLALKAT